MTPTTTKPSKFDITYTREFIKDCWGDYNAKKDEYEWYGKRMQRIELKVAGRPSASMVGKYAAQATRRICGEGFKPEVTAVLECFDLKGDFWGVEICVEVNLKSYVRD